MLQKNRLKERILEFQANSYFGGGGGDSDITSRVEPWSGAIGYFAAIYVSAQAAFNATDRAPYPGEFLAGENSYDPIARNLIDSAVNAMGADSEKIRTYGELLAAGHYLDPATNTELVAAVDAGLEKAEESLLNDVMPQLIDVAIRNGAYSGTAFEDLQDRAIQSFSKEAVRGSAAIYYENFARERAIQNSMPQIFAAAEEIDANRGKLIQANADMLRGLEQLELDNAYKHFQDELEAPWRGMAEFIGILTGGGFTKGTVHDPSKEANPLGSALQGAMGGAIAGMSFGPVGGAIGGLLGGVAGLLS